MELICDRLNFGRPRRVRFLTTEEAKSRLLPKLMPANVEKTRSAQVVAIIARDTECFEKLEAGIFQRLKLPRLFPQRDMRATFAGNQALD